MNNNIMENKLNKVRAMKNLKNHGLAHWKLQRISAIAMVPLVIWFTSSLILVLINGYEQSIEWLQNPFNATGLILLFGILYFHAASGLQVVIEDYVHHEGLKIVSLILIKLIALVLGVLSILCVLKIFL